MCAVMPLYPWMKVKVEEDRNTRREIALSSRFSYKSRIINLKITVVHGYSRTFGSRRKILL